MQLTLSVIVTQVGGTWGMELVIQAPVGGEGTSKKENERYATCPAPQEVKDCGTGLVVQVGKFQRSLK